MGKLKILLIDDEPNFLEMMGPRIKQWGFDLIEASSGREGLDAIAREHPDVVILDYMMPDMDGIVTLQEIRKTDKNLPVIMFTAHPSAITIDSMKALNITAFIPKLSIYSNTHVALKTAIGNLAKKAKKK
ncbi:MAG: response regulator [Candidatus Omnitrophica bacterium]|nr:response regulator [Candidatus Omnitrophota bacterium]